MALPSFQYSGVSYAGQPAGTTVFALTTSGGQSIGYLLPSHVHVYSSINNGDTLVELTRPAQWDFNPARTAVVLKTGIASGVAIVLQRITPQDAPYTEFGQGTLLTADQLNDATIFNLYITQESDDQVEAGVADAALALGQSATALSQSTVALGQSTDAMVASGTALSEASQALSTANEAKATAEGAATVSGVAIQRADSSLAQSSTASTVSASADAKATAALAAVADASIYVSVANLAALPPAPVDGDKAQVDNSTGVEGSSVIAGLPVGFVGDPGVFVRLNYNAATSKWQYASYGANDPDSRYAKSPLPVASTSAAGIVQLSNAVDSTSQAVAATASAVKTAADAAAAASGSAASAAASASAAQATASAALPRSGGTMTGNIAFSPDQAKATTSGAFGITTLSDSTSNTSSTTAATSRAIKDTFDVAFAAQAAATTAATETAKGIVELATAAETTTGTDATRAVHPAGLTAALTFTQAGAGAKPRSYDSKLKDVVSVKDFGAVGNGVTDDTAEIQAAIDNAELVGRGAIYFPAGRYLVSSTLTIQSSNITLRGDGINSVITRSNASYGDTLLVSAADPTTTTLFDVTISDLKFDSTVAITTGAHLEVVEAAYFTLENLSIQNGFIGMHLRGLRASNINNIHIRSGQFYGSVQAGSRFCLIEDSPRAIVFAENVEVLMANFNFATSDANAYIEHGLEIKEADGFWFDNGHIRGASVSNAFLNAASTPQLLGLIFNNVWFDGATSRCLLMGGNTGNYAGFYTFTGCLFTEGSIHGVDIATGATMDTVTFSGCQTWSIDAQKAWNIAAGDNIVIDGCSWKTLNASDVAASSAVAIASGVGAVTISGGSIKDSPNLDYGIVNNGTTQLTVTGVSFQDFAVAGRPIYLVNPATTRFASAGCTTNQATRYVAGNPQFGEILNLAADTATFVSIGEVLGAVIVVTEKFNQTYGGIFSAETSNPATVGLLSGQANFAVTTGILTGTTGTAGKLTASVTDDGNLYFENRTGSTRSLVWRIISRDIL